MQKYCQKNQTTKVYPFRSYVYFITDDHGHIKIGKANDVWSRLCELQTGNPHKLRILLTVGLQSEEQAFQLEQLLHRKFSKSRMEGEWFKEQDVLNLLSETDIRIGSYRFQGRNLTI